MLIAIVACNGTPSPRLSSVHATPQSIPADALVIINGTVINGTGTAPIPDGIVVIVKDKIFAVGRASDFSIPVPAQTIDAKGGTIMPGIINSHVHEAQSALVRKYYFLVRGVTTACDVGNTIQVMPEFLDKSYGLTARGFRAGPIINVPHGYPGDGDLLYPVTTPDEARSAVNDLVGRGADMIKVALEPWNSKLPWLAPPPGDPIPSLDLDELKAIVQQAHAFGKPVRVHMGTVDVLDEALDAGVDSIEHIPLPELSDIDFEKQSPDGGYAVLSPAYESQLARMVRQHVFMVPTLDQIIPWCERFAITPERKTLCNKYALAPVHRFHQLGGTIALGDDSTYMTRTMMPIGEMNRLAQAGLSSMEIIEAGTKFAAQVCGHGNELGTLEPGKLADVIVVNGDPLANIEIMRQVDVVIIGGQVAVPCDPTKTNC